MPKIVITEIDETRPGSASEDFDVVYIPGFVDTSQQCLHDKGTGNYVGIAPNTPTLFTNVTQFESWCGTRGAIFSEAQDYRSLNADGSGFSSYAVPWHNKMFEAGDTDPSYIMAKELLNAGLCVLYERVNGDSDYLSVTTEPEDWSEGYLNYLCEQTVMSLIKDSTAPKVVVKNDDNATTNDWNSLGDGAFYYPVEKGTVVNPDSKYYTYNANSAKPEFVETTGKDLIKSYSAESLDNKVEIEQDSGTYHFVIEGYYTQRKFYCKEQIPNVTGTETFTDNDTVYYIVENPPASWNSVYFSKFYTTYVEMKQVTGVTVESKETVQVTDDEGNVVKDEDGTIKTEEITVTTTEAPKFSELTNVVIDDTAFSIRKMYRALSEVYDPSKRDGLADLGNFSIKYLTSGGYPTYEYDGNSIVTAMITLAEKRGDCVAFIDHTDNLYRESNIDLNGSLYHTVNNDASLTNGEFATMFTPWASYNRATTDTAPNSDGISKVVTAHKTGWRMPASYAYLLALADSIKTNAPWLAVAGSARGMVLNLSENGMTTNIPNGAADAMQSRGAAETGSGRGIAVNAITNIKPYGYTIWGNRTLKANTENLVATSFLNVRNLVSDVKKTCYRAARKLTFEQNSDILWVNFKAEIAPTLDKMLSGYGISGYKIVRDLTHEKAQEKATLCAKIILYPVYAVEDFYITIVLKDDEVTVVAE